MVEYTYSLDTTFGALSDPTRRDILRRLSSAELSVGELAKFYDLTFAAISKHMKVLERAKLIIKRRMGKQQMVSLSPAGLGDAAEYLEWYRKSWETRLESLENFLNEADK
jgi:DNA-binding transcriptional ArsR family regulator